MENENVVQMPSPLERLAAQIKSDLERCRQAIKKTKEGRQEWIDGAYDLCVHLAQAKRDNPALIEFGQWCAENGFGEDALNHQDRAAAIEMGKEPDALRKCLIETKRHSLQHIYANDFPRFTQMSKTKENQAKQRHKQSSPKIDAARAVVRELVELNEPINREKIGKQSDCSPHTIQKAVLFERGRLEGLREAANRVEPLSPPAMKPTMQQRYEATVQLAKKQIREELIEEVRAQVYREVEEGYLKYWREKCADAARILASHKGVISRKDYRIVLAGLHPDHNRFEQAREAFEILKGLEDVLVKPDPPVFSGPPLPATVAELMARRRGQGGA